MNTIPQSGQVWEHYSGNRFTIILIANEGAVDRDKYPMTAVFQDDLGRVSALPLYEFYRRFTLVEETSWENNEGVGMPIYSAPQLKKFQKVASCVGCEGSPAPENSPCAVCGRQHEQDVSALVEALEAIKKAATRGYRADAVFIRAARAAFAAYRADTVTRQALIEKLEDQESAA